MPAVRPVNDLDQHRQSCLENCLECHDVCLETLEQEPGPDADPEGQWGRLLTDCAALCQLNADFMMRGSPIYPELCEACAAVCVQCADACTEEPPRLQQLRQCAQVCRRCAESCRQMAKDAVRQ